ncbi:uncharacterized protein LOC121202050 isoform X6 [Betta splendens]|uniref:Uncharacterized protein LOC121202050 isoform X6 n=1 Tax=Betta splendens TaxID=158456 RepID=A0A9W2XLX0_BETSP|nr:uncharacterized protein LOC121202050 isoform X6 [Betta splendens]
MATIRRRNTPLKDAIAHATRAIDKARELEVKYINSFKGRGLFAKVPYQKGDFIVEYRGELISSQESERRRGIYHSKCTVFMFDFCWKERMWCIDAAQEDDSLGRLVNDDHIYPNCKMKRVIAEGKPHLCLFALRDIKAGEEITYDYGGSDWPWRKQAKVQETASDTLSSEEVPQSPSPSKMQAKVQNTAADTLSSEEVPQSPSLSEMQAKTQETSADTLSSEEVPQSPSLSEMQAKTQETSADTLSSEEVPQSPLFSEMQAKTQETSADTLSSEEVPQSPSLFEMQAKTQETGADTLSSEEVPQSPSLSHMQSLQEAGVFHSMKTIKSEPLVNYTDSDDESPSISPDQLKSTCQMTRQLDLDEHFDFTSDPSGEEYIPGTSEESSDSTDTSIALTPVKQAKILKLCNLKMDGNKGDSPKNLNKSMKQKHNRGRPQKKGSNLGRKRKLHSSDSPSTSCSSKSRGADNLNSLSELKDSLPVCTSSPSKHEVIDDSVFIPGVCKKEDGSRLYNKKQYCLYCKSGYIKMARHWERAHHNKPDVALALSFPKGSKERRLHLEHVRNRGNFAHNVEVLNTGTGKLVSRKQPKKDCSGKDFLHCVYCHGLFTKKVLWRHRKICKFNTGVEQKLGKTRIQALCALAVKPPPGVREEVWKLLNKMVQDEVYHAVKADSMIMEFGEHLCNRFGHDVAKHEYIRQKMRELGRLLICSKKITSLKTIQEHVKPSNFMHVIRSVKHLAGHDGETNTYKCPSLALKIGYTLSKISMLVESQANVQGNKSAAKEACAFRQIYESRWHEMISAASLRTLQESKWNSPLLLPFTKDVQTLHSYLDQKQKQYLDELSKESSSQMWTQLTKVTLTQVILFNRRRAGEVSHMSLSAYLCKNRSNPQEDMNEALSDLEKKLCQHFRRIEIRGKRGRKVPVLLTPAMQTTIDLLVSKRKDCGVLQENPYLFARPCAMTCYRGSDCLRHFAKVCGAKTPETLTSTKLRKQTATLSQVLNLSNTELDQLAGFLGHDIRIHRQFYRLPEGTLQLAKISKVLLALEQGRMTEFKGKSLDDIIINPEENAHEDSDNEAASESEPQENVDEDNDSGAACGSGSQESVDVLDDSINGAACKSQECLVKCNQTEDGKATLTDVSDSAPHQSFMATTYKSPKQIGRQVFKRRKWENEEVQAVERHLMHFITSCRVPGKLEIDKCLGVENVALKDRDWLSIKFYVKNRITALKRKAFETGL